MPKSAWRWYLGLVAVLGAIYFPVFEWTGQVPAWALLGFSSVAAIAVGIRKNRPSVPVAWWFLCAGVLTFIVGDTTYKFSNQILHHTPSFPSFIDVLYLSMYPLLATGLFLLVRARVPGGDRASLLDALTITVGLGLLSWVFLMVPYVRAHDLSLLERLVSIAYPLGDVLVLAMLAHLWGAGGLRNAAGRLLAIGAMGTLVSDTLYGLIQLHGTWHDGNPVDLGWMLFYGCWGAAALHPSMRTLSQPRPATTPRTSRPRLALLAGVSLIAPCVLIGESTFASHIDAGVIGGAAGIMFILVCARMAGLVGAHRAAVTREQILREAAAKLVAAPGRDALYRGAIDAVRALVGELPSTVSLAMLADGMLSVVAATGPTAGANAPTAEALSTGTLTQLGAGLAVHCAARDVPMLCDPQEDADGRLFLCPLAGGEDSTGLIAVATASELPVELAHAIETLCSQVALALERENLTQAFHERRSESRFQSLVQNASDVILIVRPDTTITYQTPSSKPTLGYDTGELEGCRLSTLLHPDDVQQALAVYGDVAYRAGLASPVEWRVRHQDGSWRHVEVVANNLLGDDSVQGIVLTMRDVTERNRLSEELKHQAFHDALSGLANRALFSDRLEHALARVARANGQLAVLFLDLDDFKVVNDSLGHSAGDELLVTVAQRLITTLRGGDTAARFGGDEFAVLLEDISGPAEAGQVAERIIDALRPPIQLGGRDIRVHASLGVALSPGSGESAADVIQAADVAMYAAKAHGKGRYEVYRPSLQAAMVDQLERTAALQRAVEAGEFVLHYQPIVRLDTEGPVGVEALVRWRHPDRGLLPPSEFIPLAEETGLIVPLSRWILEQACRQVREWQLEHDPESALRVSVNISARHFQHAGLVDDVAHALASAGLPAASLVLEITETVLMQDADAVVARMLELKELGVQFAIDDFGTGYSSLSYLQRFPIDILKVDKSFIDGLSGAVGDNALARAVVQLGETLQLETVAEGIELASQLATLRALGCRYGQGFYFAKPLSPPDLAGLFNRDVPEPRDDQLPAAPPSQPELADGQIR